MITEKDMQYVLTIANYGNLTKAANALFLSQPALSIHLKQLETSIGIPLFERRGRRMILTYAGEEFVKSAREITMKCFELEDRMQDIGKNVAVKLNIGYMVRQIATLFPAVMTEFHRLYPQSVVYAIDGHLSTHEESLLSGELDMFFGYNSVSNSRLSYETIYEDRLVIVLPKNILQQPMPKKRIPVYILGLIYRMWQRNDSSCSTVIRVYDSLRRMHCFILMSYLS